MQHGWSFLTAFLHNLIFSNTAYVFLGFVKENDVLYAVLKQPFIISDAQVEMEDIKKLLGFNDFVNTKEMTISIKSWAWF